MPIVGGIVFVQILCLENRVQIDGSNSQASQVWKLLTNALNISAISAGPDIAIKVSALAWMFVEPGTGPLLGGRRIIGGITIAESLGKDLIPDRMLGPVGRVEGGFHHRRVGGRLGSISISKSLPAGDK